MNILFKLFQNETQELLDVNKTEHIFKTIMSSASISFTRDETLLSAFLNKIDSRNDNIPDYLSVIKFIVTNDKNRNGCFVYCDCQESDLYTKLFSTSDKEKIFVIKSIYNIFKQKNIDVEKIDSFTVKTYLNSEKEIDFGVFTAEEKERFLLTLTGETFKQVPLHQTIDNSYTSFTDNCYLVVDESIKLPKGYHNENISFIKLSANRELQERQKEILHDSILTETKALEILFNDNTLDLSDKEINSYLVSNINYATRAVSRGTFPVLSLSNKKAANSHKLPLPEGALTSSLDCLASSRAIVAINNKINDAKSVIFDKGIAKNIDGSKYNGTIRKVGSDGKTTEIEYQYGRWIKSKITMPTSNEVLEKTAHYDKEGQLSSVTSVYPKDNVPVSGEIFKKSEDFKQCVNTLETNRIKLTPIKNGQKLSKDEIVYNAYKTAIKKHKLWNK